MAEEKNTKVEKEIKETKKEVRVPEKTESKPAVTKTPKVKTEEKKVELEREYVVPLRRYTLTVPKYKRAKKAIRVLKEFMVKHMQIRDRDLSKVKLDINLNNEIWFRGIKKPADKIKVKAKKVDGIVYVELADIPEVVGYKIAREEKRKAKAESAKVKAPKHEETPKRADADNDGVNDKLEEKEDVKSEAIMDAKLAKEATNTKKHSTPAAHKNAKPLHKNLPKK